MEVLKVVERTSPNILEEFKGEVVSVDLEKNQFADSESDQYHVSIKGLDIEVSGKTGLIHEWIRLSPKTRQEAVPEGSIVDKYLTQLELVLPEAKKMKTVDEAFKLMVGKSFVFKKVKLGKSFEGHAARSIWIPHSRV
jgi:hypothetical protein